MGKVRDIYDAIDTTIATTLGSTWTKLRYVFDVEKNDRTTANQGYGIIPGAAAPAVVNIKAYSFDQDFEIILTRTDAREISDEDKIAALLDDLEANVEAIFDALISTNLGLPATVLTVSQEPSIDAPEILDGMIVLRAIVTVKWRKNL